MEEKLCLTDGMMKVLSSLRGKTLKSYEAKLGGPDGDAEEEVEAQLRRPAECARLHVRERLA